MNAVLDLARDFDVVFANEDVHFGTDTEFGEIYPWFDRDADSGDQLPCVVCLPIVEIYGV